MRTGVTQSSPTAQPYVEVEIYGTGFIFHSEGGGGDERITRFRYDERAWGGRYEIWLDNSDGALNDVDWRNINVWINFGFLGQPFPTPAYITPRVHNQTHISEEGRLLLELTCIDMLGQLSLFKPSFSALYYNQEWQKDANIDDYTLPSGEAIPSWLRAELVANSDKTIFEIISGFVGLVTAFFEHPAFTEYYEEQDPSLFLRKPPISIPNCISGLRQLLEMTSSYIRCLGGTLILSVPKTEPISYSYNTANSFFINVKDAGAVVPNRIRFWAFNEAGDDWIYGQADDTESQDQLGGGITGSIIYRDYILTPELDVDSRSTEAELEDIAEGVLDKIRQERDQGYLVAPMNCCQELFDRVEVVDPRYSPAKTTTGIIHRIVREYDRGKYQITLYLGGLTSDLPPSGGNVAVPLHEADPPRAPLRTADWESRHIYITCACSVPLADLDLDYNISDPGDALSEGETLTVPMATLAMTNPMATPHYPADVYIHDGVGLIDTDVTAENNNPALTYQACPTGPSDGDGLYICHTAKFDYVLYDIDTAGVGTFDFVPSYYNGASWIPIPNFYAGGDDTEDFKVTGKRVISFVRPGDWSLFTVDGKSRYILKNEVDNYSSMSTVPLIKTATIGIY